MLVAAPDANHETVGEVGTLVYLEREFFIVDSAAIGGVKGCKFMRLSILKN